MYGEKMDEKLHFRDGFRLPGRVQVPYQKIQNDYHRDPQRYPVQWLWDVQTGKPCYATFRFYLTRDSAAGHWIRIEASPYEITAQEFFLKHVETDEDVGAEVTMLRGGEFRARLKEPLLKDVLYQITVSAITPFDGYKERHGGPVHWLIQTIDNSELPVTTNDRLTDQGEFLLVSQFGFKVTVPRSPPIAEIVVKIDLDPKGSAPTELKVVLPPLFNFTDNCLVSGMPVFTACVPKRALDDGRQVASIQIEDAGLIAPAKDLRIRVRTPDKTPPTRAWFIEGLDVWDLDKQVGWAEDREGFPVKQMMGTSFVYPGTPNVEYQYMVWRFTTEVVVGAGGYLEVVMPPGFETFCDGINLKKISMPDSLGCHVVDPELLKLQFNNTLVPGEYSFGLTVTPPIKTPLDNMFSLILYDRFGMVQDAAMNLAGRPIQKGLRIRAFPLKWTSSQVGQESAITIGFNILEELPDRAIYPELQIGEILINFPVGFVHAVEREAFVEVVNKQLPLLNNGWLDYTQMDRLRFFIDTDIRRGGIKTGEYRFVFPAWVPPTMPAFNCWQISLCREGAGGCMTPGDPSVLLTFPIPGFNFGEVHPSVLGKDTADAWQSSPSLNFFVALASTLFWMLHWN